MLVLTVGVQSTLAHTCSIQYTHAHACMHLRTDVLAHISKFAVALQPCKTQLSLPSTNTIWAISLAQANAPGAGLLG